MQLFKKHKKASIIIGSVFVLAVLGLLLFINMPKEQKSLETLYREQNLAFSNISNLSASEQTFFTEETNSDIVNPTHTYRSYDTIIKNILYADLYFYEQNTGKVVTLDDVQEYLSQEYEDDGSVRIYNNGKHKNIQKYVEWYLENETLESQNLSDLYDVYWSSMKELYPEEDPELATPFPDLPFDEFVKVVEKYKDPSYDLYIPYEIAFSRIAKYNS